MSTYPKANRTAQWFGNAFSSTTWAHPDKGTLHSTEGITWPAYVRDGQAGAAAPNYTAKPDFTNKTLVWRAHFEDEESSRALVNLAGGVLTNTDKNTQVELIGTCDPKLKDTWVISGVTKHAGIDYMYWPDAPDWALEQIGDFIRYMHDKHNIPLSGMAIWKAYPDSAGADANRMTFAEWNAFVGWCGHQHVPENAHGDPGNIDFARIIQFAKGNLVGDDDMPLTDDDVAKIWAKAPWPGTNGVPASSMANNMGWQTAHLTIVEATVKSIADKVGAPVDVDEQAIVDALVPILLPAMEAKFKAILEASDLHLDADAVASKIFEDLKASIANG